MDEPQTGEQTRPEACELTPQEIERIGYELTLQGDVGESFPGKPARTSKQALRLLHGAELPGDSGPI